MKKVSLWISVCLLGVFALPPAYAQKQGLARAAKKLAEESARTAEKDLLELEKRFKNLTRFRSSQDLHRVHVLLTRSVREDELREGLDGLVRAGGYAQAADLVRAWRGGAEAFIPTPAPDEVGSLASLRGKFLYLDFYKGPDLKRAADLLVRARENGLLTQTEYRNLLRSLAERNRQNVMHILSGDDSAVLFYHLQKADEEKSFAALEPLYEMEDLHSKSLVLPERGDGIRAMAISRVLGARGSGVNSPMAKHKQFYDAQPPWRQTELDKKIDEMETRLRARAAQTRVTSVYNQDRRLFVSALTVFFQGRSGVSRVSLDVLLGPYAEPKFKKTVEKYWGAFPAQKEMRAEFLNAARALYDSHSANRAAGRTPADADTRAANAVIKDLDEHLRRVREWPEEGSDLFLRAARLESSRTQPVAAEVVRRLKAQPPAVLEEKYYAALTEYVGTHGKLPPATSPLYHALLRYKKLPGPYRERFEALFERYRSGR